MGDMVSSGIEVTEGAVAGTAAATVGEEFETAKTSKLVIISWGNALFCTAHTCREGTRSWLHR